MLEMIKNPSKYRKFYAGLLGAILTWALATFPQSRDLQVYGSLILAIVTGASVFQLPNEAQ